MLGFVKFKFALNLLFVILLKVVSISSGKNTPGSPPPIGTEEGEVKTCKKDSVTRSSNTKLMLTAKLSPSKHKIVARKL